ncbi:COG2426 family protein [Natranaerobius thermophilus]|uniref:Putative small multi-drug export n=1 Tax=Natranaerobius thermophilus (strain ATCC BAA-1301 / DSM 18059 / JW/NM-WN-LF) TaxID=457570 RepID=B2A233_NATTJ|nr:small multi-drug export protein [Natranaerobius thermophilus]ACB84838.1 putative small multi-drug export [Natranaerobius thermophilus JW/NM-WN-LF]
MLDLNYLIDVLKVIVFSMLPVVEIRGGIPLGISLGFHPIQAFIFSALGNIAIILPLIVILNLLDPFFRSLPGIRLIYEKSIDRVLARRDRYLKYGKYVLFFFVAIPFPTTGAWTACLASYIFQIPKKDSFWIISTGVLTAGLIVLLISQTTISFLTFLD